MDVVGAIKRTLTVSGKGGGGGGQNGVDVVGVINTTLTVDASAAGTDVYYNYNVHHVNNY